MFEYESTQVHSDFVDGEGKMKIHHVKVKGVKGKKEIIVKDGAGDVISRKKGKLTRKEIACIKRCQFMPGLFKNCVECVKGGGKKRGTRKMKKRV